MNNNDVIKSTVIFVQEVLKDAEKGHDWLHIERVRLNAMRIAASEDCNIFVVELGALLHDIADSKFFGGDETLGPKRARAFLTGKAVAEEDIVHVEKIIQHISFHKNVGGQKWMSPELAVVQDADRLDALGAVGIARCFTYGGYKGRPLYDPDIPPNPDMTAEEYTRADRENTTLNHFYHKLLKLKDLMNTETGRQLAEQRHQVLKEYVEQFEAEIVGER